MAIYNYYFRMNEMYTLFPKPLKIEIVFYYDYASRDLLSLLVGRGGYSL